MLTAKPVRRPVLLLNLPHTNYDGMPSEELYEAARGFWGVAKKRRDGVELALAVYKGEVVEVYRIDRWNPAGTHKYLTRDPSEYPGRWEFSGQVAEDVRAEYMSSPVSMGRCAFRYDNL